MEALVDSLEAAPELPLVHTRPRGETPAIPEMESAMGYDDQIAEKLRAVDYDVSRLTDIKRVEIFTRAQKCGIQLWQRGMIWSSQADTQCAGPLTRVK